MSFLADIPNSRKMYVTKLIFFVLGHLTVPRYVKPSGTGPHHSSYDDRPAPDFPNQMTSRPRSSGRVSADRPPESGYMGGSRRPSKERRRPSEVESVPSGRRSEDSHRRNEDLHGGRASEDNYPASVLSSTSRRKISQDTTRDYARQGGTVSSSGTSFSMSTTNPSQSTTATSGMVIPNKSTIEEEYIEVPYGKDADDRDRSREASTDVNRMTDGELESASDYASPRTPLSPPAGLSGLSARLRGVSGDDEDRVRTSDDFYDKYGRSSTGLDQSLGSLRSEGRALEDSDKIKKDYEYKIVTMQTQISNLHRDLEDMNEKDQKLKAAEAKVWQMEQELVAVRRVSISYLTLPSLFLIPL